MESSPSTSSESDEGVAGVEEYLREKRVLDQFDLSEDETTLNEEPLDPEKELADLPRQLENEVGVQPLGTVFALLTPFVVVKPSSSSVVLDIGTLVTEGSSRTVLGQVWEVFGPVADPFYSILVFPSCMSNIKVSDTLFFSLGHCKVVSKENLIREKGIDVGPEDPLEFSDDETERISRKGKEEGEL